MTSGALWSGLWVLDRLYEWYIAQGLGWVGGMCCMYTGSGAGSNQAPVCPWALQQVHRTNLEEHFMQHMPHAGLGSMYCMQAVQPCTSRAACSAHGEWDWQGTPCSTCPLYHVQTKSWSRDSIHCIQHRGPARSTGWMQCSAGLTLCFGSSVAWSGPQTGLTTLILTPHPSLFSVSLYGSLSMP